MKTHFVSSEKQNKKNCVLRKRQVMSKVKRLLFCVVAIVVLTKIFDIGFGNDSDEEHYFENGTSSFLRRSRNVMSMTKYLARKWSNKNQTYKRIVSTEIPENVRTHLEMIWKKNEVNTSIWLNYLPSGLPPLSDTYKPVFNDSDEYRCHKNGTGIKLLVVVSSGPRKSRLRINIRKTWGFYRILPNVKIVFFIGKTRHASVEEELQKENHYFKDIVRFNRFEKYIV